MTTLEKDIVNKGNSTSSSNYGELRKLISRKSVSQLKEAIRRAAKNDPLPFWDSLLKGFTSESKDKRFECVKELLHLISADDNGLSIKKTSDLITRLCLDLHSFPNHQLVEIVEHCMNAVRVGNGKDVSWKDLMPQTLITLTNQNKILVNDVEITGQSYRDSVVVNLTCAKWNLEILTPLANLFVDLNLSPKETTTVLKKFCNKLQQLNPPELPSLAYQLFTLSKTANDVTIVILAFQEYFHFNYYKRLFADLESNSTNMDSIDNFSEKEIRESEETILHHLSYCTQYKIKESQVRVVLQNLTSLPELVLKPFVLSAFLSLTVINREPESSRLTQSEILRELKSVVKNNEEEKEIKKRSGWARGVLKNKSLDLEIMLNILIDQNKEGKDVITPGLVNLMFLLLKEKRCHRLNNIAISFLTRFIRKRFIFGQGIIKKLADWMIVEQDSPQYSECLTNLSISDTFTVSECTKTIQYVLDFLLNVSGKQAMRNMLFILPIVKISHTIRDSLIDVLRKAMTSKDTDVFEMGVYGFCLILKQLTNHNSQRGNNTSGNMTQLSISGFSLISQATVGVRSNPQRHFDMLVLEIIGLLRNCFQQCFQIKKTLYENLMRAADLKTELIPHILQFVDFHFRSYFTVIPEEDLCEIHFDNINEDNLGLLTNFVTNCVYKADNLNLNYETSSIKNVLNEIVARTVERMYRFPGEAPITSINQNSFFIAVQCMNFLEALIAYLLRTSTKDNENCNNISELFKIHVTINKNLKNAVVQAKKVAAKKVKVSQAESQGNNPDLAQMKKAMARMESIWDFTNIEKLLRLLFEESIDFASETSYAQLRTNRDVIQYVLQVASMKIENLRNEPDYKQVTHSTRIFKYLTDISNIIFNRLNTLDSLWSNFDSVSASLICQCLFSILETVEKVFPKKFDSFLKESNFSKSISSSQVHIVDILEMLVEKSVAPENAEDLNTDDGKKITMYLLRSLEIIFRNLPSEDHHCINGYTWSLKFCENNRITKSDHGLIHKILFHLRERTFSGEYLKPFVEALRKFYGSQSDEEDETEASIKSIGEATVEECCSDIFSILTQKLEDVDYVITKTNNMYFELSLSFHEGQSIQTENLKIVEKTICHQLLTINQSLLILTDTTWPLGTIMNGVLKILMHFYNTMTNLTKHFILRQSLLPMTSGVKFDELLKEVGRPLGQNTYALLPYIDSNIFQGSEQTRHSNANAAKAKVLKETRFIPKLVLKIETFNKFVMKLSKVTKKEYNKFLHIGTVRDFRIRTSELKNAIDRTLDHSSQIDDNEDEVEEMEEEVDENEEEDEEEDMQSTFCSQDKENSTPIASNETNVELEEESTTHSESQVMRNLDKINKKARRRSTKDKELEEEPKPKRGRRTRG